MVRFLFFLLFIPQVRAQKNSLWGMVKDLRNEEALAFCLMQDLGTGKGFVSNEKGFFSFRSDESQVLLRVSATGYKPDTFLLKGNGFQVIFLQAIDKQLNEVVVSGHLGERLKSETVMPIETYTPTLFKKTWAPSLFESMALVNGVQPQINCNVCSAGDIQINGLEGPYTMVLIDGMPIMSSLSTVYGMSGIPRSLLKRVEITKGAASTLYGSEAMAGTINIITKDAASSPRFSSDVSISSIGEINSDFSSRWKTGKASSLLGINMFHYGLPKDMNQDGFTDLALQSRISVFNKWDFERKGKGKSTLAFRVLGENRWGGQLEYGPRWVGSDSVYGETIKTRRLEILGTQALIENGKLRIDYAFNSHSQKSWYGLNRFDAEQHTAFAQLVFSEKWKNLNLITGLPFRLNWYDDNTPATQSEVLISKNKPDQTFLPGIFAQADYQISPRFLILAGLRLDRHPIHGQVFTPRMGFRFKLNESHTLRLSGGSGFRVVNLFTEDHAALSGARKVVIQNELKPERSWNANAGYEWFINHKKGFSTLEINAFYTRFSNRIVGDFLIDPNKIIYDNLDGFGISQGIYLNYSLQMENGFRAMAGTTFMDVYQMERLSSGNWKRNNQIFAPAFSGTFSLSWQKSTWNFDFSGRITGPMKMPVLENDFRAAHSPVVSLLNFQISKAFEESLEFYGGVRNILNVVSQNPIMRPFDPFDKRIDQNNPNGYTFDPGYHYAPMQGTTLYLGLRWHLD